MITRPKGLTLIEWADAIILDLDRYGAFSRLDDELLWQDWAVQFLNNSLIGRNLPNPYGFADWREWAELMCNTTLQ